jgi:autotransporter-associated beta strand protein
MKFRTLLLTAVAVLLSSAPSRAQTQTWNASVNTTWDNAATNNWGDDGLGDVNWQSGDAVFGSTGAGTVTIAAGGVSANSLTFDASGYTIAGAALTLTGAGDITANANATISSVIAGGVGLKTFGTGTLTLTGAITYAGSTTISAGRLILSGTAAISGFHSNTMVASGATLEFNSSTTASEAGNYTISGSGTVVKSGAGLWVVGPGPGAGTVSFNLSAGGLLDIQGGIIQDNSATQSFLNNLGSINIASGATLDFYYDYGQMDALTGAGTLQNGYPGGNHNVTIGVSNGSGTFAGVIRNGASTPLNLTKNGTGMQTFTGASSYTGTTTVAAGTLSAENNKALGNTSSLIVNGGTLNIRGATAGTVTIGGGGNFTLTSGTIKLQLGTTFDQLVSSGAGTFTLTGGTLALDVTGTGFSYGNSYQVFSGFGGVNTVSGLAITGYDTADWSASLSTLGVLRFTAVPEPSTLAMLLGGIGMLTMFRRRAFPCMPVMERAPAGDRIKCRFASGVSRAGSFF